MGYFLSMTRRSLAKFTLPTSGFIDNQADQACNGPVRFGNTETATSDLLCPCIWYIQVNVGSRMERGASSNGVKWNTDSEADTAFEAGNYTIADSGVSNDGDAEIQRKRWDLNYREAAIFLQEGENNDKFTAHPLQQVDLKAYMIAHSQYFYVLSMCASLLLLSLAVIEPPALPGVYVSIPIHACLELFGLIVIAIQLGLKIKWLGIKMFIRHVRSMIKAVILIIMFIEAVTVMIRQESHFRVTRALRPVFLLDAHYCRGVRRFIRQIMQSLPPIIDMLVLLMFFILLFSMLGFYIFSGMANDTYFKDFAQSFISLFILLTSANFPDVMMPVYKANRWSCVFFIIYISIEVFLFMNLFLAVVYSSFLTIEKEKLKKLLLHRRQACSLAFRLLVSSQNPSQVSLRHFTGCLRHFRPRMSSRAVYLSFKLLNSSKTGKLTEEEFAAVYDVVSLKWKQQSDELWSERFVFPFNRICYGLHRLVSMKWFNYSIYVLIAANFVWILADVARISVMKAKSSDSSFSWAHEEQRFLWISVLFVCFYVVEAVLKICGFGPSRYFASGWNIFDFIVVLVSLVSVLMQYASSGFYYTVVLRPLRVLRLFKLKRRFRDVFGTLFILLSRMFSVAIAILLLYYFFAIIGMELFASYTDQLQNCCRNTSVEQYYSYSNITGLDGYYYLNTFENILSSGVTLFELTVVNNWWIIMEGYASVVSEWTRVYFMVFYVIIMIVMTVVVAFILEAFIFRIQYRMALKSNETDDNSVRRVFVKLCPEELQMCDGDVRLSGQYIAMHGSVIASESDTIAAHQQTSGTICFCGEKSLSKNDFSLKMYGTQVQEWISESSSHRHESNVTLDSRVTMTPNCSLNSYTTVVV